MKGIRPEGTCPKCKRPFRFVTQKMMFLCKTHLTMPQRFSIDFHHRGERFRRSTTFDGKTLRTFADAHGLLKQAHDEIDAKRFDPDKWRSKTSIDYRFSSLIWKWYAEKERLMEQGKLATGYVPKLKTYITCYIEPHYLNQDVREIFNCKDFANGLRKGLSPKYEKNIVDALKGFFNWCKANRYIQEVPVFPRFDIPEYEPQTISKETQLALLACVPPEHRPIFTWLFYQGCRPGEVRALKWDCVNEDVVTYKRTFSGRKLAEHTKTKNIRYNLIFPEVLAVLPAKTLPTSFVFTHGKITKNPYSSEYLNKIFRGAVKDFNEEHGSNLKIELYESTKHSFGTQLINEGFPENYLQEWFGHTKGDMTKRYAKLRIVDVFRRMKTVVPIEQATSRLRKDRQ